MKLMKRIAAFVLVAVMTVTASACGDPKAVGNLDEVTLEENDTYAVIKIMDYGEITAKLFPGIAPESVKRFVEFAERGYYDGKTIHRVIDNVIIQGGSLNGDGSDGDVPKKQFVPLEISNAAYNFYGALCFAATPKKGSYAQFYIVDNHTPQDIDAVIDKLSSQLADEAISARLLEKDKKYYEDYLAKLKAIPENVKEKYKKVGGQYDFDGDNTVFGQVIGGWEVLDAISSVEVVSGNKIDDSKEMPSKPLDSIVIETIEIVHIEPEVTTEETTTAKETKAKKTTEKINAETLPTAASEQETTVPAETDGSASDDTSAEENYVPTDNLPESGVEAVIETTVSSPNETEAEITVTEAVTETVTEITAITSYDPDDEEIIIIEE